MSLRRILLAIAVALLVFAAFARAEEMSTEVSSQVDEEILANIKLEDQLAEAAELLAVEQDALDNFEPCNQDDELARAIAKAEKDAASQCACALEDDGDDDDDDDGEEECACKSTVHVEVKKSAQAAKLETKLKQKLRQDVIKIQKIQQDIRHDSDKSLKQVDKKKLVIADRERVVLMLRMRLLKSLEVLKAFQSRQRKAKKEIIVKEAKVVGQRLQQLKREDKQVNKQLKLIVRQSKQVFSKEEFLRVIRKIQQVITKKVQIQNKIVKKNIAQFKLVAKEFQVSKAGQRAEKFCASKTKKGTHSFEGCMQDMRLTHGNKKIVIAGIKATKKATAMDKAAAKVIAKRKEAAVNTRKEVVVNKRKEAAVNTRKEAAVNKRKEAAVKEVAANTRKVDNSGLSRTCTANGDPHYTNFNGEYFHPQVNGIFTLAKSTDGEFEVQMKQSGFKGPGSFSVVRSCKILYQGDYYSDNLDKDGIRVNCGSYQASVTVPGRYIGKMQGLCGANGEKKGAANFALPNGDLADVNYGEKQWELGGYGGKNAKMSKWQYAWRPSMKRCMFSEEECAENMKESAEAEFKGVVLQTPHGPVDFGKLLAKTEKKIALKQETKDLTKKVEKLEKKNVAMDKKLNRVVEKLEVVDNKAKLKQLLKEVKKVKAEQKTVKKEVVKANLKIFETKSVQFRESKQGQSAAKFCASKAEKGSNAFDGCMQDMRLTHGDKKIAGKAAVETKKAIKADKAANKQLVQVIKKVHNQNPSKKINVEVVRKKAIAVGDAPSRTCTANGDPHYTNFNGEYFHPQVDGIFTLAKSADGKFEVQIKQDGFKGPGSFSLVRGCKIKYAGEIYTNVLNKDGIRVDCRHHRASVTIPGKFLGKMQGLCGINGLKHGAANFALPDGKLADVNYGEKQWGMGGYGGKDAKLSKWQYAWRPSVLDCMFSKEECAKNMEDSQEARCDDFVITPFGRVDMRKLR